MERNGTQRVSEQRRQLKALVLEHLIARAPLGLLELIQQGQNVRRLPPRNRRTVDTLDGRSGKRRDHVITGQFLKYGGEPIPFADRDRGVSLGIYPVPSLRLRARKTG